MFGLIDPIDILMFILFYGPMALAAIIILKAAAKWLRRWWRSFDEDDVL